MSEPVEHAARAQQNPKPALGAVTTGSLSDWAADLPEPQSTVVAGDARKTGLEANSVDLVVTSRPYWAKRDYGHPDQIGQEAKPEGFVSSIMDCLAEWKRVLRPTGSIFLNIGDTYHKRSLVGIPGRIEAAAVDAGWSIRNRIIWAKTGGMPEPARNRLAVRHEYIIHFNIAKYLQTGPSWESEEWAAIYHTARNSIEGTNAHIKDGNGVSLAQHSKRLLRSFAGQAFLVGFIVLSHSLRVLNSFLERMERADLDGPPPTPPRTLIGDDDWESLSEETGKGRDPAVPPLAA